MSCWTRLDLKRLDLVGLDSNGLDKISDWTRFQCTRRLQLGWLERGKTHKQSRWKRRSNEREKERKKERKKEKKGKHDPDLFAQPTALFR
jgi:hypothetical protein